MARKNKYELYIEANIPAQKKLMQFRKEWLRLGGAEAVKVQRQLKKYQREINLLGEQSKKTSNVFTKFTNGIALGNMMAMAGVKAVGFLKDSFLQLNKAILVAGQIEELGHVYKFVGQQAGYSRGELEMYVQQLRDYGIRQDAANQAMLRAIQANIDLKQATKFARIAQDAATVGLMESSEAYNRIIESVAKLYPRLLKEIGIIVNLNVEYAKYAKSIGKSVSSLTEAQKKTAMMNAIMEKGTRLTGAYETAMEKASKRLRSIPRWFMDAQQAVGRHFLPAFNAAIDVTELFLKTITSVFGETKEETNTLERLGTVFGNTAAKLERLNAAFKQGGIEVAEYRKKVEQIVSDMPKTVEETEIDVVKKIVAQTKNYSEALEMVTDGLKAGLIPGSSFNRIMKNINDEYIRIANLGKIETFYEFDYEAWRQGNLVIKDTSSEIEKVQRALIGLARQGMFFENIDVQKEYLLDVLKLDPKAVEAVLGGSLQKGINKAIEQLKPPKVAVPPLIMEEDYTELFTEMEAQYEKHLETTFDSSLKWQLRKKEAEEKAETLRFEARIALLNEFKQKEERINRFYDEQNFALRISRLLDSEAQKEAIENNEILRLRDHYENMSALAQEYKDKQDSLIDEQLEKWSIFTSHIDTFMQDAAMNIIYNTGNISEAFDRLGKSIMSTIISIAMKAIWKLIAAQTTQIAALAKEAAAAKVTAAAYWNLAAAKTAAGMGWTSFLPFDDPVNDAALIREHRKIGQLIAKGLAEGTRSVISNRPMGNNVTISAPITVQGGLNNAEEIAEQIATKIENLRSNYSTRILTEDRGITR